MRGLAFLLALAPLFPPLAGLALFFVPWVRRLPLWGQALLALYGASLLLPALFAPEPLAWPLALFRFLYVLGLVGLGVASPSSSSPSSSFPPSSAGRGFSMRLLLFRQRNFRNLALEVFGHLHALSLRFHLERQTGGLSRVIERGTQGMEFLIRFMTFNILPTLFEIGLVGIILWNLYDWRFTAVTLAAVGSYIVFSIVLSEWRIAFVRRMNDADTEANAKAIDSLLNYETVKYFGNEDFEARRYDESLQRLRRARLKSQTSLSLLNAGQQLIISVALVAMLWRATQGDLKK